MTAFKWEGMDQLKAALARIPKKLARQKLEEALLEAAEPIRAAAAAKAPRSAGRGHGAGGRHLADSIVVAPVRVREAGDSPTAVKVAIGPAESGEHFYAAMVEFGASDRPGQPFLRPALDEGQAEAFAAIGRVFAAAVKDAVS
jgi:HK97 gp10 family phage protein